MEMALDKVLVRKWVGTQNCPFTNHINTECPDCGIQPPTHFRTNTLDNKGKETLQENEYLTRMLDRGIDDMEAGRELPLNEAFQKTRELRDERRK